MPRPRLTFACELDPARLTALFSAAAVTADLQAPGTCVVLMLSDPSAGRAAVVRRLKTRNWPGWYADHGVVARPGDCN